jgi:hypothetical protein
MGDCVAHDKSTQHSLPPFSLVFIRAFCSAEPMIQNVYSFFDTPASPNVAISR